MNTNNPNNMYRGGDHPFKGLETENASFLNADPGDIGLAYSTSGPVGKNMPGEVPTTFDDILRPLQDNESIKSISRKNAPAKAVFEDLPTAYSSILARSGKYQKSSNGHSGLEEGESSIPLQDFQRTRGTVQENSREHPSLVQRLSSTPAPGSYIYRSPHLQDQSEWEDEHESPAPTNRSRPNVEMNIRRYSRSPQIAATSSPDIPVSPAAIPLNTPMQATSLPHFPSSQASASSSQKRWSQIFSKMPLPTLSLRRSNAKSTGEGSTIHNIYQQYADSSESKVSEPSLPAQPRMPSRSYKSGAEFNLNLSSSSTLTSPKRVTALQERRRSRARGMRNMRSESGSEPPSFDLPELPVSGAKANVLAPEQGLEASSSYGDTHNLLKFTQHLDRHEKKSGLTRSTARYNLRSEHDSGDEQDDVIVSRKLSSNNPYRKRALNPVVSPPSATSGKPIEKHPDLELPAQVRLPLEKEVSKALRRASRNSGSSFESAGSSFMFDPYDPPLPQRVTYVPQHMRKPIESSSSDLEMNRPMKSLVSDPEVVDSDIQAVAAQAIYDPHAIPSDVFEHPPQHGIRIPVNKVQPLATLQSKGKHSAVEDDKDDDWETVGGSVWGGEFGGRGGDGGSILGGHFQRAGSSIAGCSDTFSSLAPEIDQFGSTERIAQHPGDIRYAADYRQYELKNTKIPVFLPSYKRNKVNGILNNSSRHQPRPNLFSSSPPPLPKHKNPFQSSPPDIRSPPSTGQNTGKMKGKRTATESEDIADGVLTLSSLGMTAASRPEWMYTLDGPSRAHAANKPSLDDVDLRVGGRCNSWDYVMNYMVGKANPVVGNPNSSKVKERPMAPGWPPGEFYRGVRTTSFKNQPAKALPEPSPYPARLGGFSATRKSARGLRSLSLVSDQTSVPNWQESSAGPNDFVYRTPLAPPKDERWRAMYTAEQLEGFDKVAKLANFREIRRIGHEPPRLVPSRRENLESRSDEWGHQASLSTKFLLICALMPLLLPLYAKGDLDPIMEWWSQGAHLEMSKSRRRWAWYIMGAYFVILVVGLTVFGVIYGVHHSSRN
jgi:hypothetical protein